MAVATKLSSGAAARLAGVPRTVFLTRPGRVWSGHLSPDQRGLPEGNASWL